MGGSKGFSSYALALALVTKPVSELRLLLPPKSPVPQGQESRRKAPGFGFKAAHLCVLGSRV
jgi:hypothetical protein